MHSQSKHSAEVKELREKFKISWVYFFEGIRDGKAYFSFCGDDITVDLATQKATVCLMTLNSRADQHEFRTFDWPRCERIE